MAFTRAQARNRMLLGLPPEEPRIAPLALNYQIVLDHWFANGCTSKRQAMIAAGLKPRDTSMFHRKEMQEEIRRRRERMEYRSEITEEMIEREYAKIAFASLGEMLEIQDDGSATLDMASMSSDQKAALSEYHVESYQTLSGDDNPGQTVKKSRIKFHDKKAALDSLARIRGMMKDKLEVTVGITLADKVQQARQRLVEQKTITQEGDPA